MAIYPCPICGQPVVVRDVPDNNGASGSCPNGHTEYHTNSGDRAERIGSRWWYWRCTEGEEACERRSAEVEAEVARLKAAAVSPPWRWYSVFTDWPLRPVVPTCAGLMLSLTPIPFWWGLGLMIPLSVL